MATLDTYDTVGIRQDLQDAIYDISPTTTPFMSTVGRTKAKNTSTNGKQTHYQQ